MFFPSRADAWYFRQTAYDFAGLTRKGVNSHDAYPPAKITVITRKRKNGRYFDNEDAFLAVINATGLEVDIVQDLGKLPFKQLVAKMAGTGILIAAHGAALVNAMFLPQHAVVVEIFPYYMKKMTYVIIRSCCRYAIHDLFLICVVPRVSLQILDVVIHSWAFLLPVIYLEACVIITLVRVVHVCVIILSYRFLSL